MYVIHRCFLHGTRSKEQRLSFFAHDYDARQCLHFPDVSRSYYENWVKDKCIILTDTVKWAAWEKLYYHELLKDITQMIYPDQGIHMKLREHF